MKRLFPLLAACLLSNALAQPVYKCTQGGKTTYADRPCAAGKSVEMPPAAGVSPEGAETVATRDARTARAAAAHRKQCDRLHLRKRWADEDAARLTGRGRVAAQRRAKRAQEALAVECPA